MSEAMRARVAIHLKGAPARFVFPDDDSASEGEEPHSLSHEAGTQVGQSQDYRHYGSKESGMAT